MGENTESGAASASVTGPIKTVHSGFQESFGNPITQRMRIIGQRRRDAEEKLEHHLQEARAKHPAARSGGHSAPDPAG